MDKDCLGADREIWKVVVVVVVVGGGGDRELLSPVHKL